jgi:phosphoribosyl-ATP pyrophosphohydrolase
MAKTAKTEKKTEKKLVKKKPKTIKKLVKASTLKKVKKAEPAPLPPPPPLALGLSGVVLDRLYGVVLSRKEADPAVSHSARLLSRGPAKVAQKFGEEAVECLIEAVAGHAEALIAESADVLYHLLVLWVACGVRPEQVWAELQRREGVSGIAEKASRRKEADLPAAFGLETTKIP